MNRGVGAIVEWENRVNLLLGALDHSRWHTIKGRPLTILSLPVGAVARRLRRAYNIWPLDRNTTS